jgi:hypothetical protein
MFAPSSNAQATPKVAPLGDTQPLHNSQNRIDHARLYGDLVEQLRVKDAQDLDKRSGGPGEVRVQEDE